MLAEHLAGIESNECEENARHEFCPLRIEFAHGGDDELATKPIPSANAGSNSMP